MELVACLSNVSYLPRLCDYVDGILFGSLFSLRFHYSLKECEDIVAFCRENNLKTYLAIDALISENDKTLLYNYFEFVRDLNVDGIYFSDLGIINVARGYGIADRLIYEADTLMTNSLDVGFYLSQGIDVVLARELCLDEVLGILKKYPGQIDMQIFGHLRMSRSKRKFLSNYFKEINKLVEVRNKNTLSLIEESRAYNLPIVETKNGTNIYTDYILLIYDELPYLMPLIKRGIIDSSFVESKLLFNVIGNIKRISKDNASFMKEALIDKFKDYSFSEGYFYRKTVNRKDGE